MVGPGKDGEGPAQVRGGAGGGRRRGGRAGHVVRARGLRDRLRLRPPARGDHQRTAKGRIHDGDGCVVAPDALPVCRVCCRVACGAGLEPRSVRRPDRHVCGRARVRRRVDHRPGILVTRLRHGERRPRQPLHAAAPGRAGSRGRHCQRPAASRDEARRNSREPGGPGLGCAAPVGVYLRDAVCPSADRSVAGGRLRVPIPAERADVAGGEHGHGITPRADRHPGGDGIAAQQRLQAAAGIADVRVHTQRHPRLHHQGTLRPAGGAGRDRDRSRRVGRVELAPARKAVRFAVRGDRRKLRIRVHGRDLPSPGRDDMGRLTMGRRHHRVDDAQLVDGPPAPRGSAGRAHRAVPGVHDFAAGADGGALDSRPAQRRARAAGACCA